MNNFSEEQLIAIIDRAINDNKKIILMEARLEALEIRVQAHDERFLRIEMRLDSLEGRFDVLEGRFDILEGRFDILEGRFDGLQKQFDGLKEQFHFFGLSVEDMKHKLELLLEIVTPSIRKTEQIDGIQSTLDDHECRLKLVEHSVKDLSAPQNDGH